MFKSLQQGRLLKHPLHGLVVHVPIGLWAASVFFDILFFSTRNPNFATTSYYCVMVGLLGAIIAIPTGAIEYFYLPRTKQLRRLGLNHLALNAFVTAFFAVSFVLRKNAEGGSLTNVSIPAFVMSALGFILLSISGYLGGRMVYEYRAGAHPEARDPDQPLPSEEEEIVQREARSDRAA